MIILVDGNRGMGKTLTAVKEAYAFGLKGYKILSNLKLDFPDKNIDWNTYKMRDVMEYAKSKNELKDIVVLMDELQILLDSRMSMTKRNILISYFLMQTRKRNVHIIGTTQYLHQVDKRIRSTCDMFISSRYDKKKDIVLNRLYYNNMISYRSFKGSDYFSFYDTNFIIDPFEE
jgi:DNA helicase HerA-like ATPase